VGKRLVKALIFYVVVRAQAFVPLSGTPYVLAQGKDGHLSGEPEGRPLNERPALSIWVK
jgi:hypothetical protein